MILLPMLMQNYTAPCYINSQSDGDSSSFQVTPFRISDEEFDNHNYMITYLIPCHRAKLFLFELSAVGSPLELGQGGQIKSSHPATTKVSGLRCDIGLVPIHTVNGK